MLGLMIAIVLQPTACLRTQTPGAFFKAWVEADSRDVWRALGAGRRHVFDGRMMWGILGAGVGYIGLTALYGFSASGDLDDDLAMQGARSMIIGVTQNLGGSDAAAWLVVSRFADKRRVVYANSVHNGRPER